MLWQPGRTMEYELLVDGNHLREGLRIFKLRRKLRATDKATVAYADGFVIINALDRGFVARAAGLWPGIAQAGASRVMALARVTRLLSPLGVTEDDLRTLVERRISERWGMPPDKAAAAPQRPIDDVS